jgi:hypothetical protein
VRSLTVLYVLAAGSVRLLAQAELRITDPPLYAVVHPGQTISVKVSAKGGPFKSVILFARDHTKINGKDVLDSPPYEFSFTIPPSFPTMGNQGGGVMGFPVQGQYVTANLVIDIERPDAPKAIKVDNASLELSPGDTLPIQVFGRYDDGAQLRLTNSTQTKYEVDNPKIVSVGTTGVVTAIAEGAATVTVRHLGLEATVRVKVVKD